MFKLSELLEIPTEAELYETVAGHFNDISAEFYGRANRRLLEELAPKGPVKVLDLACGTGALVLEIARQLPQGQILGVDLSEKMLAQAKKQSASLGLTNARFHQEDIRSFLPNHPPEFDLGLCCFALSYLGVDFVLKGLHQALKPGGQIGITTSSFQSLVEWQQVFIQFFVENQGKFDFQQIPNVPEMPMGHDDLKKKMEAAGFEKVHVVSLIIPLEFENAEEAATFLIASGWLSNQLFAIKDLGLRKFIVEWASEKIEAMHAHEPKITTQVEFLVGWNEGGSRES